MDPWCLPCLPCKEYGRELLEQLPCRGEQPSCIQDRDGYPKGSQGECQNCTRGHFLRRCYAPRRGAWSIGTRVLWRGYPRSYGRCADKREMAYHRKEQQGCPDWDEGRNRHRGKRPPCPFCIQAERGNGCGCSRK